MKKKIINDTSIKCIGWLAFFSQVFLSLNVSIVFAGAIVVLMVLGALMQKETGKSYLYPLSVFCYNFIIAIGSFYDKVSPDCVFIVLPEAVKIICVYIVNIILLLYALILSVYKA